MRMQLPPDAQQVTGTEWPIFAVRNILSCTAFHQESLMTLERSAEQQVWLTALEQVL